MKAISLLCTLEPARSNFGAQLLNIMNHLDKIPKLVADGRIEDALDLLSSSAAGQKDIAKDVVHLLGRWAEFSKNRTRGVLSHSEEALQYARITASVLDLSERLAKRLNESRGGSWIPKSVPRQAMLFVGVIAVGFVLWLLSKWLGDKAFYLNISLQPQPELVSTPPYPPFKDATLYLRIGGEWEEGEMGNKDDAAFQNIPADYLQEYVQARLEAKYWKLRSDTVLLEGPSQTLWIVPDGSLSKIKGRVVEVSSALPLEGVTLTLAELSTRSDSNGMFLFDNIPLHLQQQSYRISARKKGYKIREESIEPATKQDMIIPMYKDQ